MKLKTIIKKYGNQCANLRVCVCYFNSKKMDFIDFDELTATQLDEKWYSSEWWIESGDLCLMRGR